ncbi:MAG: phosphate ABC transporter permease subunit PstC [Dehalococcoidia bacterium]|nr:phosphate ABC transporter permease subunit PstC [Dehalococcoidia bacterium]
MKPSFRRSQEKIEAGAGVTPLAAGLRRRHRPGERLVEWFIAFNGLLAVAILVGIFAFLLKEGLPFFADVNPWKFITGTKWYPVSDPPTFGLMPSLVSTLWVTLIAAAVAVPIGIACAAYLSEVAPQWLREIAKPVIELLAGIPSVVIGFIGLMVLAPFIKDFLNLNTGLVGVTAGIMLAVMSLPLIISISEDAMAAVPDEYRKASYALGSTRWQTIRHVIIPSALSGISAAVMLGIGRAIGETMTVLMVAGGALSVPGSPLEPMRPMTATIAAEINNSVQGGLQYHALFAIGMVLFILTFMINLIADLVLERQRRKFSR